MAVLQAAMSGSTLVFTQRGLDLAFERAQASFPELKWELLG